jgi:hypothetical protein
MIMDGDGCWGFDGLDRQTDRQTDRIASSQWNHDVYDRLEGMVNITTSKFGYWRDTQLESTASQ